VELEEMWNLAYLAVLHPVVVWRVEAEEMWNLAYLAVLHPVVVWLGEAEGMWNLAYRLMGKTPIPALVGVSEVMLNYFSPVKIQFLQPQWM
jgi:hypothetical protein